MIDYIYYMPIIYSFCIPILLFIGFGGVSASKNFLVKFNRMNSILFRFKKNGKYKIIVLTLLLIIKTFYYRIISRINNNIIKKYDNIYEITFYIRGNKYILYMDTSKRPEYDVLQVLDQDLNDYTDDILPYLGNMEEYNKYLTPKYFNKNKLIFTLSDNREIVFMENDIIKLWQSPSPSG